MGTKPHASLAKSSIINRLLSFQFCMNKFFNFVMNRSLRFILKKKLILCLIDQIPF